MDSAIRRSSVSLAGPAVYTVCDCIAGPRDVVTGRDGKQAELFLRTAHSQGLPVRGLAMADVPASRRPLAQVRRPYHY